MNYQSLGVLGIKTVDDRIIPLLDFGVQRWNQTVFTTIVDRQKKAVFDFYYRDRRFLQWVYLDSLAVDRIPPARAGEPNLSVKAQVDGQGNLALQIHDPVEQKPISFLLKAEVLIERSRQLRNTALPAQPSDGQAPIRVRQEQPKSRKMSRWVLLILVLFSVILGVYFLAVRPLAGPGRKEEVKVEVEKAETTLPGTVEEKKALPAGPAVQKPKAESIAEEQRKPPEELRWYRVSWGDTLWQIAERFYGDRNLYPELAESNELTDPDYIIAGESLHLPPTLKGKERAVPSE